jgi:hypothetical protein
MKKLFILGLVIILLALVVGCHTAVTVAPWDPGFVYARGDLAEVSDVVYESLAGGNVGHSPALSPGWWQLAAQLAL